MNRETLVQLMTKPWITDAAHALVRIVTGVLLVWHGSLKVFDGMAGLTKELTELGWPWPALQAFAASYIEFAGGILMTVGLFTRPVAFATAIQFVIITFVYSGAMPFKVQEKPFLFLLLAIFLFLTGPGKWSVDARLFAPFKSGNGQGA